VSSSSPLIIDGMFTVEGDRVAGRALVHTVGSREFSLGLIVCRPSRQERKVDQARCCR